MAEHEVKEPAEESEEEPVEIAPVGFATGIALDRVGRSDSDEEARTLLREQAALLRIQSEHLHEQRVVQLSHLKARRLSEWLKVGLQVITACVGCAVALLIAGLIWDAARSRNVVVDAFDAPPALAARGESGKVVANEILDGLTRLQKTTRAAAVRRKLVGAWSGDIKVEVPATGVSIGELRRLLHEMLGQDVHVEGDLVQDAKGGLALTVRGDDVPPTTFVGGPEDLTVLANKAAEYIYGEADPYLFAAYLSSAGRTQDALQFLSTAYPSAKEADQPDLLNQWGNAFFSLDQPDAAGEKYRAAITLKPDFWKAWGNLVLLLGSTEEAFKTGEAMVAAAKKYPSADQPEPIRWEALHSMQQDWDAYYGDVIADKRHNGAVGSYSTLASAALAFTEIERHDWNAAQRNIDATAPEDAASPIALARLKARHAVEAGRAEIAATALQPLYADYVAKPYVRSYFRFVPCELGLALGLSGHISEANDAFSRGARWIACTSYKGDVLDHAGDWSGAVSAYQAAISLAPDLPLPYERYAVALSKRGNFQAAIDLFAKANARGPHWADPLKYWGDILSKEGRWSEAAQKYTLALSYAPAWSDLITASNIANTHVQPITRRARPSTILSWLGG